MRALTLALAVGIALVAYTGCGVSRIGTIDPDEVSSRNDTVWRITAEPRAAERATDSTPPEAAD